MKRSYALSCLALLAVAGPARETTTPPARVVAPLQVTALAFRELSAGAVHTCGRTAEGVVFCWGNNSKGQLGDGTKRDKTTPVAVAGERSFVELSAGGDHTCARTADGVALCWGNNRKGQLGDGTTGDKKSPVAVARGRSFVELRAGYDHTCGRTGEGEAFCWGGNALGQLGDGTTGDKTSPVAVAGGLHFVELSAGAVHTCGRTAERVPYCWGAISLGPSVGPGEGIPYFSTTPVAVKGGLHFVALSAGGLHTCGRTAGDVAFCWGDNRKGEVGDGTTNEQMTPVVVAGGLHFVELSAGFAHTCGRTEEGEAFCWGDNRFGQLGDSTTVNKTTPVAVAGGRSFVQLSAGSGHTCGRTAEGVAFCWGVNDAGELGDGTTSNSLVPVPVMQRPDAATPVAGLAQDSLPTLLEARWATAIQTRDSAALDQLLAPSFSEIPPSAAGHTTRERYLDRVLHGVVFDSVRVQVLNVTRIESGAQVEVLIHYFGRVQGHDVVRQGTWNCVIGFSWRAKDRWGQDGGRWRVSRRQVMSVENHGCLRPSR